MKPSLYLMATLSLVMIFVASGCGSTRTIPAYPDKEFSLAIGQIAYLEDEKLYVKFTEVTEDSRCPAGVTCIWAGRVTCKIELAQPGASSQVSLTQSGLTDEHAKERYRDYELFFYVTPYPQAGKSINIDEYRLHLLIKKSSKLTELIGTIIDQPSNFEGKAVIVIGYYRGWDLLHETDTAPPVTRSDWVIKDLSGAIYVSANSGAKLPEGLHPGSLEGTGNILKLQGIVHITQSGQPYIEAIDIERLPN